MQGLNLKKLIFNNTL